MMKETRVIIITIKKDPKVTTKVQKYKILMLELLIQ